MPSASASSTVRTRWTVPETGTAAASARPRDIDRIPAIQARTIRVLAVGQVFGGIAVAGSVAAGSLIAASVAGTEAAAGLAQTAGVLGAAALALPLAQLALTRGRRAALSTGYGIGALGSVLVVVAAVQRNLPLIYGGCLLVLSLIHI